MYKEQRKENWTQRIMRENLDRVAEIIKEEGGYREILNDMHDFERFLSRKMGCSIKKAKEYISTIRGASIYMSKKIGSLGEEALKNKDKVVLE